MLSDPTALPPFPIFLNATSISSSLGFRKIMLIKKREYLFIQQVA